MNGKKKIVYEQQIVDKQTGEVVSTYSESVLPKEPDYVKLYLASLAKLNDLQGWTDPILRELLRLMNYRNEIVLNGAIKKRIAKELGISTRTIDNGLSILSKHEIITRQDVGLYLGNPHLFGKGEWRDIRELRMKVVFNKYGQSIETEVVRETEELDNPTNGIDSDIKAFEEGEKVLQEAKNILAASILPIDPEKAERFIKAMEKFLDNESNFVQTCLVGLLMGATYSLQQIFAL